MDPWTALGITAGALTSSGYLPQIVKGFRTKSMADVSLLMPAVLGTGMLLWLLYGLHKEDIAIIAANVAGSILASTIIWQKLHYGRRATDVPGRGSSLTRPPQA